MSDIQELIAHSTVKAFNQGLTYERERIIKLLLSDEGHQWLSRWTLIGDESDLVAYIKNGENK